MNFILPLFIFLPAIIAVGSYGFYKHATKHTDGSDDIQTADTEQKGLMSSVHANRVAGLQYIGDVKPSAVQWGLLAELTTHPLGADGTAGRIPRGIVLKIDNGTNAETLKCTVIDLWNGDAIAETDNITKDATTGNFSLNADGTQLRIKASGLTGNVVFVMGILHQNASGADLTGSVSRISNEILIMLPHSTTAVHQDITTLVDTGKMYLTIFYITDA